MAKTSEKTSIFERFVPMILVVTVGLAFLVGMLWQKVSNLESSGTTGTNLVANNGDAPADVSGKLTSEQAGKLPEVTDSDHILGSKDADVLLIEYSDFECPFCERFHPTAKQAVEEYGDRVALVYRHFPLETLHTRAYPSAIASECVAKELGNDGFWKFIDTVFSDQEKYLTDEGLKEAAANAGATNFNECFANNDFEDQIRETASNGSVAGVTGTPATFIKNKNGDVWLIPGALPYESLKATIEEALK